MRAAIHRQKDLNAKGKRQEHNDGTGPGHGPIRPTEAFEPNGFHDVAPFSR